MRAFLIAFIIASVAFAVVSALADCSVCNLVDGHNETNGYGCFQISKETVACTCPDQRYVLNQRCRICDRPNICGPKPTSTCSERSPTAFGGQGGSSQYFACFCENGQFQIGKACP